MTNARPRRRFLPEFLWPVPWAHRDFVLHHFFDSGSLFHSVDDIGTVDRPKYSITIHSSVGGAGAGKKAENLTSECVCTLHLHQPSYRSVKITTTNGVVIDLLKTGDIDRFMRETGALESEKGT